RLEQEIGLGNPLKLRLENAGSSRITDLRVTVTGGSTQKEISRAYMVPGVITALDLEGGLAVDAMDVFRASFTDIDVHFIDAFGRPHDWLVPTSDLPDNKPLFYAYKPSMDAE